MSARLKGTRLEAEVDRCRSECKWKRLGELLPSVRSKNSGMEQFADLLDAEYILEAFIERHSGYLEPELEHKSVLGKAERFLLSTLEKLSTEANIRLEASLLLAKLHYYCADFEKALKDVEDSHLERGNMPFVNLRDLRLVAEAYAIKGFSTEALIKRMGKTEADKARMGILFCFEKSAELAISYVQELEKSFNLHERSNTTSASNGENGKQSSDRMGELLETTLERVPLLRLRHDLVDRPWDDEGVEWYRRIMTSLGDKVMGEKLQQKLSRQLAEVLLRGLPDAEYRQSQAVTTKTQSLGFYTGSHQSYFSPASRIEEVLLLLLISEVLATKDVVLSRAEELSGNRRNSLQTAKGVYNLLTLVLSALRQYELLAGIYEKATKFANEEKYIWFQFALTLLCHGRYVRASRILSQCIAIERRDDNVVAQHLFAAQIAVEHLGQYDIAIAHTSEAIEVSDGNWLTGRCYLLKAVALSLKAETIVRYKSRIEMQTEAVKLFEKAAKIDPHDELAYYFCARQYAIARNLQSAKEWCQRALEMNPEMPAAVMLLALIFTAQKDYRAALELIVDALDSFPTNIALLILKLKLEAKFGRTDEALLTSHQLLYFWKKGQPVFSDSRTLANDGGQKDGRESLLRSVSSRDAVTAAPLIAAAPLGFLPSSALARPLSTASGSLDVNDGISNYTTAVSELCADTSTLSDISGSHISMTLQAQFRAQANIWLELAELFLDLDRMAEVRPCVEEACSLFPSSHQTLYIKGRLLATRAARCTEPIVRGQLRTDAKASLLGALAISPSHISSLRHLANIYRSEGNVRMAEKMLRDIVHIDPLQSDSWQSLGMILSEDGRFEEALECFSTASALSSTTPLIPFTSLPLLISNSA